MPGGGCYYPRLALLEDDWRTTHAERKTVNPQKRVQSPGAPAEALPVWNAGDGSPFCPEEHMAISVHKYCSLLLCIFPPFFLEASIENNKYERGFPPSLQPSFLLISV